MSLTTCLERRTQAPTFAGIAFVLFSLAGCYSTVGAPISGSTVSPDDVWYVKQKYIFFVRVEHDVFYCPPAQTVAQKVCTKALMHDE
jgi:hypothetical protein